MLTLVSYWESVERPVSKISTGSFGDQLSIISSAKVLQLTIIPDFLVADNSPAANSQLGVAEVPEGTPEMADEANNIDLRDADEDFIH
ncbi:hypothetical protein V6N12_026681 [Hibiscus sabdariffa]|uniref:Uncharacterized protein n=1 Tax=Hibiscus sabdariffa TaxID=183260 RepID=A0ABR2DSH0_9ROSI